MIQLFFRQKINNNISTKHTQKNYFGKILIRMLGCQCQENLIFLRNIRPIRVTRLDTANIFIHSSVNWVLLSLF